MKLPLHIFIIANNYGVTQSYQLAEEKLPSNESIFTRRMLVGKANVVTDHFVTQPCKMSTRNSCLNILKQPIDPLMPPFSPRLWHRFQCQYVTQAPEILHSMFRQ